RGLRVRGRSLDVGERLTLGEVLTRVDVEVVAPEHVLVGCVARAAGSEVAGVTGEAQGAVVDGIDRDVATGDVVAEGPTGATVQDGREETRVRRAQVGDERRRDRGRRQLAGAAGEVDVLREGALLADRVTRVLARRRRTRHRAIENVTDADGLNVVTGQVNVEVERRDRQIRPQDDVGE